LLGAPAHTFALRLRHGAQPVARREAPPAAGVAREVRTGRHLGLRDARSQPRLLAGAVREMMAPPP
jgi:hypothetical protein